MTKNEKIKILELYKNTFNFYLAVNNDNKPQYKSELQGIKYITQILKIDESELIEIENSCTYKGELFTAWQDVHNWFKKLNPKYTGYRWTLEHLEMMIGNYDYLPDNEYYQKIVKHEEYIKRLMTEKEQRERAINNLIQSMIN